MTELKLSDLFKDTGRNFNWETRMRDQELLVKRLEAFPELKEYKDDVESFCHNHIASVVYAEWIMSQITKSCAKKNISIS